MRIEGLKWISAEINVNVPKWNYADEGDNGKWWQIFAKVVNYNYVNVRGSSLLGPRMMAGGLWLLFE